MKPANLPLSVVLTLGVHLLAGALLFWQGGQMRDRMPEPTPEIIRAQVVAQDPADARRAAEAARQAEAQRQLQQREAERRRQQEAERQRQREAEEQRRQREQEEARRRAEEQRRQEEQAQQEAERQAQQEAERQRQLQLQRQREAEQRARTEAEQQRQQEEEIRRRVEEERAAEARRQREEEARIREESQRAREEARAEQAERDAQAIANMEGVIFDLIASQWTRPPGTSSDLEALIRIRLLGTGELAPDGIRVVESSGNAAFDRSAIQAIERAAPFPLLQLESRQREAFRVIDLIFSPEDLAL
ncbi:colicin import membrane protein [Marinospirillum celere]|uniref:Colicin import membrane protein n=1 Tax=Marinospirillum celere TaxID=1122252 RepID=A0A1I1ESI4_9GAMM|nr:cell envelope integrity protein TolA [Marinospirillum celere]SFB90074.1 colicin import membrane protein [Marinospirillum celere]